MVRDAICRMLEEKNEAETAKPISNEELEQILATFAVSPFIAVEYTKSIGAYYLLWFMVCVGESRVKDVLNY